MTSLILLILNRQVRVWSQLSCTEASDKEASLVIDSGENIAMAVMAWEDGRGLAYGCDGECEDSSTTKYM